MSYIRVMVTPKTIGRFFRTINRFFTGKIVQANRMFPLAAVLSNITLYYVNAGSFCVVPIVCLFAQSGRSGVVRGKEIKNNLGCIHTPSRRSLVNSAY